MNEQMSIYDVMEQVSGTQKFTGKKYETARTKPAKLTQEEKIFQYMQKFGSITPVQAFEDLGIMRLGARIYDMEQKGIRIEHGSETKKNRYGDKVTYARYSLA